MNTPPPPPNQPTLTTAQRRHFFEVFLEQEGYPVHVEDDHVRFKCEGRNYAITLYDDDDQFVRLAYPNFWKTETNDDRCAVLLAAMRAMATTKGVKVFHISDMDNTWATVELFFASPEQLRDVFHRAFAALRTGVAEFVKHLDAIQGV